MPVNKNAINKQIQDRGQFSQIPNEIWEVKDLSIYARAIWIYLLSCHPQWKGSIANLSRNLGFSYSSAKRAVEELEDANMLKTTQNNKGTDFDVRPSSEWSCRLSNDTPDSFLKANEASLTAFKEGPSNTRSNTILQDSCKIQIQGSWERDLLEDEEKETQDDYVNRLIKEAETKILAKKGSRR